MRCLVRKSTYLERLRGVDELASAGSGLLQEPRDVEKRGAGVGHDHKGAGEVADVKALGRLEIVDGRVVHREARRTVVLGDERLAALDVVEVVVDAHDREVALHDQLLVRQQRSASANANVQNARARRNTLKHGAVPAFGWKGRR